MKNKMKLYKKVLKFLNYTEEDWAYEIHKQIPSFLFIKVIDNKVIDAKILRQDIIYKAKEFDDGWEYLLACYDSYCECNYCQTGGEIDKEIVEDECHVLEVRLDCLLEWIKKGKVTKRNFNRIDNIAVSQLN